MAGTEVVTAGAACVVVATEVVLVTILLEEVEDELVEVPARHW